MAVFIKHVAAKNYRALADLTLDLGEVDVLFGPNGAGKSTLLDVLWFIRDCAVRGAAEASATRSHGIGMLFDGVDEDEPLEVSIETNHVTYALKLSLSSGRLEAFPGERLRSLHDDVTFIDRSPGSTRASFFHAKLQEPVLVSLREPEKLSLTRYLDFEEDAADIAELDRRLRFIRFYPARTANFRAIKRFGSERGYESWVFGDGTNLWSVLSNIHNKMAADDRYATIMGFMRESFPSFKDLVFETTGATSVYGSFVERGRRKPILASGVSDGHLQMLFLLTALFGEGPARTSLTRRRRSSEFIRVSPRSETVKRSHKRSISSMCSPNPRPAPRCGPSSPGVFERCTSNGESAFVSPTGRHLLSRECRSNRFDVPLGWNSKGGSCRIGSYARLLRPRNDVDTIGPTCGSNGHRACSIEFINPVGVGRQLRTDDVM